jgi:hypothetical protein
MDPERPDPRKEPLDPQRQPDTGRMNRPEPDYPPDTFDETDEYSDDPASQPAGGGSSANQYAGTTNAPSGGRTAVPPPPAPKPPAAGPVKPKSNGWLVLVLLAILLGGGYYFMSNNSAGGSSAAPSTTAAVAATDEMSPNYAKHKNADPRTPMSLSRLDLDQKTTDAAVKAAQLGQPIPGVTNASPELIDHIKKGDVKFYTVRAYDTCAEDGDYVTITTSNGAKIGSFMLTIAGRMISIPVVGGAIPNINLIGDRDGVGGITAGVQTSGGTWYSGILDPGQMQPIPLEMR